MKRYWPGVLLICVGVLFLLDSLDILNFHHLMHDYWPVLIILVGVFVLVGGRNFKP